MNPSKPITHTRPATSRLPLEQIESAMLACQRAGPRPDWQFEPWRDSKYPMPEYAPVSESHDWIWTRSGNPVALGKRLSYTAYLLALTLGRGVRKLDWVNVATWGGIGLGGITMAGFLGWALVAWMGV